MGGESVTSVAERPLRKAISSISSIPKISKLGVVVMIVGLVLDTIVHVFLAPTGDTVLVAGFSAPEHGAHFVVLIGMLLVIVGVMADGARLAKRQRLEREGDNNALR